MPVHRLRITSSASGRAVYLNHPSVDDDKDGDAQNLHGDADDEGLQVEAEQFAKFKGHEGGLQSEKGGVVHRRVARDDAARLGHHRLREVKHRHGDVEGIGDEGDGHEGLEHPAKKGPGLEAGQIVVVNDHLDQLSCACLDLSIF